VPRRITPDTDPNGAPWTFSRRPVVIGVLVVFGLTAASLQAGWPDGAIIGGALALLVGLSWAHDIARQRARHPTIVSRRPYDDVVEVLGAQNLRATLKGAGLLKPHTVGPGITPSYSLVISDDGVELWRRGGEPVQVADIPWSQVDDVGPARAALSSAGLRLTAGILLTTDYIVCVVPLRRVGGFIPGSVGAAQRMIVVLRAHLDAYDHAHGIDREHGLDDDEDLDQDDAAPAR
jgi:hypothetical protein